MFNYVNISTLPVYVESWKTNSVVKITAEILEKISISKCRAFDWTVKR